ncbi:hypothetical protein Q3268_00870 [Clostridioides difficile]
MKTKEEYLKEVRNISEEYFRKGEFFCSEAVLQTINDALGQPLSPEITVSIRISDRTWKGTMSLWSNIWGRDGFRYSIWKSSW